MSDIPVKRSHEQFNTYAAMDAPVLPVEPHSALQVQLARWQNNNFKTCTLLQMLAGVFEEGGELSHAILKHQQGIRGMGDPEKFRALAGDAIADIMVYLTQLATMLRLDIWTLYSETAYEVMQRNWAENPDKAHEWEMVGVDTESPEKDPGIKLDVK